LPLDVIHLNCRSDTFLRGGFWRRRRVDLRQEELWLEDVAPLVQRRHALVDWRRGVGPGGPIWPHVLGLVRAEEVVSVNVVLGSTNHLKQVICLVSLHFELHFIEIIANSWGLGHWSYWELHNTTEYTLIYVVFTTQILLLLFWTVNVVLCGSSPGKVRALGWNWLGQVRYSTNCFILIFLVPINFTGAEI